MTTTSSFLYSIPFLNTFYPFLNVSITETYITNPVLKQWTIQSWNNKWFHQNIIKDEYISNEKFCTLYALIRAFIFFHVCKILYPTGRSEKLWHFCFSSISWDSIFSYFSTDCRFPIGITIHELFTRATAFCECFDPLATYNDANKIDVTKRKDTF